MKKKIDQRSKPETAQVVQIDQHIAQLRRDAREMTDTQRRGQFLMWLNHLPAKITE